MQNHTSSVETLSIVNLSNRRMNKSVYKYAAESGVPVGIYLTAMSACFLLSLKIPLLPLVILPLALGFPFLLGRYMRRVAAAEPKYARFASLWLYGIYTVIFGVLICSLISALWLVFADPGFLHEYIVRTIAEMESLPDAARYAESTDIMREALEQGLVPSGTQFVASMAWLTSFGGSVLSLFLAWGVSSRGVKKFQSTF